MGENPGLSGTEVFRLLETRMNTGIEIVPDAVPDAAPVGPSRDSKP